MSGYLIEPIARVVSPFRQKFGIPRQAGLVPEARGWIELLPPYDQPAVVDGLEEFSHLWLTFVFHAVRGQGWRARVRPPRLGGNRARGVFATRSPYRPNHLGLSVVELLRVETVGGVRLQVAGLDLLDGTPVVDIRPYLPYADALPAARGGFADQPPQPRLRVTFTPAVQQRLQARADGASLAELLRGVLALDPRPAYHDGRTDGARVYGLRLADLDVRFRVDDGVAEVLELAPGEDPDGS
jgi:tRNA-Thr(GGU) m(6)t(6)A37 methyltransferase TsaA